MTNLIIIGGGNSIRAVPSLWEDARGIDVMTVNHAYRFVKETPKYQVSIDRKFWKENAGDMDALKNAGCKLVNRNREYTITKTFTADDKLFCGARKLSGVFALSYATRKLNYDTIYLFGFDFGMVNGKTHFYDDIKHSGIGKYQAYLEDNGNLLSAVDDFNRFKNYCIYIVGESNIRTFPKITYDIFIKGMMSCRTK